MTSRKRHRLLTYAALAGALAIASLTEAANAESVSISLREVTAAGLGKDVGRIMLEDSRYGLLVKPDLTGLQPGPHGLHVHENADCGSANKDGNVIPGGAAGGHYDPKKTEHSDGPYGQGALGDLPNLIAEQDGTVAIPTLAPRLKVRDVRGRSLVVHAGADRYGHRHGSHHHGHASARRIACGIIE